MTLMRGAAAMRKIKTHQETRAKNRGYSRALVTKPGEAVLVRFRGLMTAPGLSYPKEVLEEMTVEDLMAHAVDLQAVVDPEAKTEDVIESVLARYEQIEPLVHARHYIERNSGKKGLDTYCNCGDSETALMGDIRRDATTCRYCYKIQAGDKGIGWPQGTYYFSVWDYRKVHQIKDGDERKYEDCTMDETGACRLCRGNKGVDPKSDDYMAVFDNGMRFLRLAGKFADAVLAADRRVGKYCRSCLTGKIKPSGAMCANPDCGEEFDWDSLIESGWLPDQLDQKLRCSSCRLEAVPLLLLDCSKCDNPQRANLCDVDCLVEQVGSGTSKNFLVTEQLPLSPLDPEDEMGARILAARLPNYEQILAPDPVDKQLKNCQEVVDPLGPEVVDAPTVSARTRRRPDLEPEDDDPPTAPRPRTGAKMGGGMGFRRRA